MIRVARSGASLTAAGLLLLGSALVSPGVPARAAAPLVHTVPSQMLVTARGMTLYVFSPDHKNQSVCTGVCAKYWPPLLVPAGIQPPASVPGIKGVFGMAPRADGTQQLTYDGAPLYTWIKDQKPGDMTGQGIDGIWWVVAAPATPAQAAPDAAAASLVKTAPADVLVTALGMTLYVFAPDMGGQSVCTGTCARFWPSLRVASGTSPLAQLLQISGQFGMAPRTDGGMQLTYDGAPLYTFVKDQQPGDLLGQGVGGTWWVAVAPSQQPVGSAPVTAPRRG